jgi:ATP-dependent protease ClpP protease subunit
MQEQIKSPISARELALHASTQRHPHTVLEYFGVVNYATNARVIAEIKEHLAQDPETELTLLVTSPGGPSGTAMSFYDTMRSILKPRLTTIAMGDVDSSGIIIFLAADTRLVSKHTTLLLHPGGRTFDPSKRYTAAEIAAMAKEDQLKDEQYADIVASHSRGRLTKGQVLTFMECHTVLSAQRLLELGLSDGLIG